jgi:mRNA-degrading endonuclease toxin of MazEF toxin-antitoxin module
MGGLLERGKVVTNQIRTVDKERLSKSPLGSPFDSLLMDRIARGLKVHLDLD